MDRAPDFESVGRAFESRQAQPWTGNDRANFDQRASRVAEAMDRIYILNDNHPADYVRANFTLQQMDEFYRTYGITESDGMYVAPKDRVAVW